MALDTMLTLQDAVFEDKHVDNFNATFHDIEKCVPGRLTEILAIRYALALGQHTLLYGPHGTAKSYLANTVFSSIENASLFSLQLRKEMGVDYVFGPMDIRSYREKGVVEHNSKGMLPECDFAFLDEFFDANDSVLRGLLESLFERKFMNKNIPLRSVIATTNFYEQDDKKNAVIDRFMFRVKVEPLAKKADKRSMLEAYMRGRAVKNTFDVGILDTCEEHIPDVTLDKSYLKYLFEIVDRYGSKVNQTYAVSDRRLCWCSDMLKAAAYLQGRSKVIEDDFISLYFVLGVAKSEVHDAAFFSSYEEIFSSKKQESSDTCEGIVELENNTVVGVEAVITDVLGRYKLSPDTRVAREKLVLALSSLSPKSVTFRVQTCVDGVFIYPTFTISSCIPEAEQNVYKAFHSAFTDIGLQNVYTINMYDVQFVNVLRTLEDSYKHYFRFKGVAQA